MAFFVSTPPVVGAPGEVHTSQQNALLAEAMDNSFNHYVYLKGVSSLVSGDAVTYDENGVTTLLAGNAKGPVAIATADVDASTEFGWFLRQGVVSANLKANSADNGTLGIETTAGKLGDGRAAGDQIIGVIARGATSGSDAAATIQIASAPFVDDFQGA